jgi:hypothetical protein
MDIRSAVELTSLYQRFNMEAQFMGMAGSIIASSNMPPEAYGTLAQLCVNARKWDLAGAAMKRYLEKNPGDYRGWIELGGAEMGCGRIPEALSALTRAVGVGGEPAREILRQDQRFVPLRSRPDFRALAIPSAPSGQLMNPALSPFLSPSVHR